MLKLVPSMEVSGNENAKNVKYISYMTCIEHNSDSTH